MKKILVFRLSAMGDVALTVPVIRNVIESNSDLHITLVTRPFFAPFFFGIPRLKLYFPKLEERHKGLKGLYRLYKDLKELGPFGEVIDLHAVLRTRIVNLFSDWLMYPSSPSTREGRRKTKSSERRRLQS